MVEDGNNPTEEFQRRPEVLDDAIIDTMLVAFGNSEAKTTAVMAMKKGTSYSKASLHRLLLGIQGVPPVWKLNPDTPFGWCEDSFEPNGIVQINHDNESQGVAEIMLTDFGELGKSFAGHIGNWSLRHESISLIHAFGYSQPGTDTKSIENTTSPSTRLKILRRIVNSNLPLQNKTIAESVKLPTSTVGQHLSKMSESKIIQYDSLDPSDSHVRYRHNAGSESIELDYPTGRIGNKLPMAIRQLFIDYPDREWTQGEIALHLINQGRNDTKTLRHNISRVLGLFKKTNIVETGKFDYGMYSIAKMDQAKKVAIAELINIIDTFKNLDQTTIDKGHELAIAIVNNPEQVAKLMEKAGKASSFKDKIPKDETIQRLIGIVGDLPSSDTRSIQEAYIERYGPLSKEYIGNLLTSIVGEKLIVTKVGRYNYWNLL